MATAFLITLLADSNFSTSTFHRVAPGYISLLAHALSSSFLEHTFATLVPSLGTAFTYGGATVGAAVFSLPFYIFKVILLNGHSDPVLPLLSLASLPFLAYTLLFFCPLTSRSLDTLSFTPQHFQAAFPQTVVSALVLGNLAFSHHPKWVHVVLIFLLYNGLSPDNIEVLTSMPRTPASKLIRSYLKTILSNPESRKIFYFLVLNISYMGVQMLYGVWTNSLGLISDG